MLSENWTRWLSLDAVWFWDKGVRSYCFPMICKKHSCVRSVKLVRFIYTQQHGFCSLSLFFFFFRWRCRRSWVYFSTGSLEKCIGRYHVTTVQRYTKIYTKFTTLDRILKSFVTIGMFIFWFMNTEYQTVHSSKVSSKNNNFQNINAWPLILL